MTGLDASSVAALLHEFGQRSQIPAGVLDMLTIPGVRPDKVIKLHRELGIASLTALEDAAPARLQGHTSPAVDDMLLGLYLRLARPSPTQRQSLLFRLSPPTPQPQNDALASPGRRRTPEAFSSSVHTSGYFS